MDMILYCTKYRDMIRSQNTPPYHALDTIWYANVGGM